ncbi:hypothetical protein GCM10007242_27860 [Pigmentiphaga litoralis]|uniref:DNA-binding protein n=1 Tax=Pigmentiphaga litoralis TaxID=516702 RepID=UPI001673055F|nr:DNA-binding protein [Pigmentiphaga litoralis]GGX19419.1 hypothetical protein GCM10007242_27860 [Pigmentiphaga litoralis]
MSTVHNQSVVLSNYFYSTAEAATLLRVRPQTLRKAYSASGAYFGIRPRKAKNGRLLWAIESVVKMAQGEL